MDLIGGILIAVALAMDSFSVSISAGASVREIELKHVLLAATYFGFFQFFMTVLGWYGGLFFSEFISEIDHWVAFGLLLFIGGKMIIESFAKEENTPFAFHHKLLFMLAIATSIDALGVGLSYAFLEKTIFLTSILIGIIAFAFSYTGVYLGKLLQKILGKKMEFVGGIILLGIGFKILVDHGVI